MSKFILIGSEEYDVSTERVCQWIDYYGYKFIRLNIEDTFQARYINMSDNFDIDIDVPGKYNFKFSEIRSFWFRRGGIASTRSILKPQDFTLEVQNETVEKFQNNLVQEQRTFNEFVSFMFEFSGRFKILGNPTKSKNNKLTHLWQAKIAGLNIPATYVISEKKKIEKILSLYPGGIIIKPISDSPVFNTQDLKAYQLYTNELKSGDITRLPETFSPCLIQEKISKKIELRIFFMGDQYYPMAIFSQSDIQTSIDFRRYNWDRPNRMVPFILPEQVSSKLSELMESIQLNTGSIDMILGSDGQYYFLEVNPVGQFGMVSMPCNYPIEKKIAEYLIF